jgi:hypothetical protein
MIALCCGNYREHQTANVETLVLRYLLSKGNWSKQSKVSFPNKCDTQLATRQAFLQILLSLSQGFDAARVAEQDSENCSHLALTSTCVCLFLALAKRWSFAAEIIDTCCSDTMINVYSAGRPVTWVETSPRNGCKGQRDTLWSESDLCLRFSGLTCTVLLMHSPFVKDTVFTAT